MATQARLIEAVLGATPDRHDAILKAATGAGRARPVTAKVAAELLGVHPKTLLRYSRQGLLHPVKLSQRMFRWDMNEIEKLLGSGERG